MYVDNGTISNRQTFRLYVFDLMGIATLLLPPYLAKLCGADGIFAILGGSLLGVGYLLYLGWIIRRMRMDLCSYLEKYSPLWIRKFVYILIFLHSIFTTGFCAYVFTNLMRYSLVKEVSFELVLLVTIVVAAYAVLGGLEGRARVYEVMFWFVLVPYAGMMLASVRNCELVYLDNFFNTSTKNILEGSYLVFLFLTPLFFSLFLIEEKEKSSKKTIVKTMFFALVVSAGILLGSYVLLLANFGEKALSSLKYPVITLMSTVQFEGNFLKRMDAIMLVIWFFTLYALLNLHMHYGTKMIKKLSQKNRPWQVLIGAVLAYFIAYGMRYQTQQPAALSSG